MYKNFNHNMSKKRGPNSPMESEKTKQSTSAVASTLGMAAVLSAVSHVFSNQGASSIVSDSDDFQSQTEEGNGNDSDSDNPWTESNLNKSKVKAPREKLKPIFESKRDGAVRDEIEIEINTKNGKKFTGSITPLEIKHKIYIDALKFPNHSNFDGARVGYRGRLIATIKLIEPINIDELSPVEHFEFKRTSTFNGSVREEVIGCKIRGIRWQPNTVSAFENPKVEDGTTVVKIEGCDYMVPEEQIMTWLSHYGEFASELEEDLFKDNEITEGNNRTGNYSIVMKLEHKIPQLIPMNGRRVKIYHKGIEKLCTKCFAGHRKSECRSETKVDWIDYVKHFMELHDFIPRELYGKWNEFVDNPDRRRTGDKRHLPEQQTSKDIPKENEIRNPEHERDEQPTLPQSQNTNTEEQGHPGPEPTKEQFDIPTTDESYERMVDRFATVGLQRWEVDKTIEAKNTAYNKACREHKKLMTEYKKKRESTKVGKTTRRNSLKH
jgi:hypothetical protein